MTENNNPIVDINNILEDENNDEAEIFSMNKKSFFEHLQGKLDKITTRCRLIKFKYSKYKQYYDWVNISIIIVSTILTLIESGKNEFGLDELEEGFGKNFLQYLPVFFSCIISTAAAILKFKKYQEKMEMIGRTIEKSIFFISKIKKLQEELYFTDKMEDIDNAKSKYQSEIYELYNACNEDIEKHLKDNDHMKFQQKINNLDLEVLLMEKSKEQLSNAIDRNATDINQFIGKVDNKVNKMKLNFGDNIKNFKDEPQEI